MHIRLAMSYCLILGFLFLNEAKSGFILEGDVKRDTFDEEGCKTPIKVRNIDVYFGGEEPEEKIKAEAFTEFDSNDLNDLRNTLNREGILTLTGISLGKVSFHDVNNNNELTAMQIAIRALLSTHDDMEADGRLEKEANDFIRSKLTESNRREDSSSEED